ncbi:MAG: GSU2403 family nucleotidyltransferase fold protein [Mariprofundus sp.]
MCTRQWHEIDFLTPMRDKPDDKPAMRHGAGVHAEPLRFLDYLIKDPQESVIMSPEFWCQCRNQQGMRSTSVLSLNTEAMT